MPASDATLKVPSGAVVTDAVAHVKATGVARWTTIGQVAQVRAENDGSMHATSSIIIDFGGQVTLSGLRFDNGWDQLDAVGGSTPLVPYSTPQAKALETFAPTRVSQLRLKIARTESPPVVAVSGSVLVALPPADLEVFVNGTRAWVRPGPAQPKDNEAQFKHDVVLTHAFQDEVDAGRVPLEVTARSRTPADLTFTLTGSYLRTHKVMFAEGPTRSVAATAEGDLVVALALPPLTTASQVRAMHATVTAQTGPERVVPPDDPPLSGDAALIVDPDRAASIRLPAATSSFAALAGVRLPLRVGAGGAELRGVLRVDRAGEPGAVLPRGNLGPATVEAGAAVRWVSLLLPKAQKLPSGALWLDVVATRGSVEWPLAAAAGAPVLRPVPGGGYRPVATIARVDTNAAALRVIGVPVASAPVFPVALSVAGAEPATVTVRGASADVSLVFSDRASAPAGSSGALALVLTASTSGTFTLSDVSVEYDLTEIKAS